MSKRIQTDLRNPVSPRFHWRELQTLGGLLLIGGAIYVIVRFRKDDAIFDLRNTHAAQLFAGQRHLRVKRDGGRALVVSAVGVLVPDVLPHRPRIS